jgi:hypothetical protein
MWLVTAFVILDCNNIKNALHSFNMFDHLHMAILDVHVKLFSNVTLTNTVEPGYNDIGL